MSDFPDAERALKAFTGEGEVQAPIAHEDFPDAQRALAPLLATTPDEQNKRSSVWAPDVPIKNADEPFYLLGAELGLPYLAGRGILAAGSELGAEGLARFLTGQAGKGLLSRLPSLATSGAWQGALGEGVDRLLGAGHDLGVGGASALGAGVNALTGTALAPFVNHIAPEVAKLAQRYMAQGIPLRTYQIPGASTAAKFAGQLKQFPRGLLHRLAGLSNDDVKKLSGQLMASIGSKEDQISAVGIKDAQQDIAQRANTALQQNDRAAFALARNQWINSKILENNPSIWNETTGQVNPAGLYRVINSRTAGYGGVGKATQAASAANNPVDIGTLAEGGKMFAPQSLSMRDLAHTAVAGGGLLGFGELEGLPLIEALGHHPASATGAVATLGAMGGVQNTQPYTNWLLNRAANGQGSLLAGMNPLIPAAIAASGGGQNGERFSLNDLNPIGTANAGMHGDQSDWEQIIRDKAGAKGIDPDIAVRVARTEGLGDSYAGDQGSSFGPFQLHYGGMASGGNAVSGLGDLFTKETGLHASDPRTVPAQIDFALDYAKEHGWSSWHGWKGDPNAGLNERTSVTVPMRAADQPNDLTGSQ